MREAGETSHGFLRDTLAPLVGPGRSTYEELKQIIFGVDTADGHVSRVFSLNLGDNF